MELYQVEDLNYYYPEKDKRALVDINLKISEGEFILLTGPSGCGKSSLLRALAGLIPDYYGGAVGGEIRFDGRSLLRWDKRQLARDIGLVFQDPEQQLVMTSVEQEIAFGLENLGIDPPEMRRRVAEVLSLFDLTGLKTRSTFTLSGGQKQKVVLAAVLAMYPRVLLLDEPTSQLDPVAAQELLNYIQRLNLEWGLTIILVEQRTDRCFHLADRIVLMEEGRVIHQGTPREMAGWEKGRFRCLMPPVAQVFSALEVEKIPLTIKEGRQLLHQNGFKNVATPGNAAAVVPDPGLKKPTAATLCLKKVEFAYDNRTPCLKGVNLSLDAAEITVILGENGAGKSTLLKTINGLLTPQRGKIFLGQQDITGQRPEILADQIGYLSQDPNDYLFHDTVGEEIAYGLKVRGHKNPERVQRVMELLEIGHLSGTHPRDASGGERQRIALGTALVTDPPILLLDEPTRGLDPQMKQRLAMLLRTLQAAGKTVVVVTHDVEFAAAVAGRVVILSDGQVVADGKGETVLANSLYYAPQVSRLFRGLEAGVLTVEMAIKKLNKPARGVG